MTNVIKIFLIYNMSLFKEFLSIKMSWVQAFVTNLEKVSPYNHVV